MSLREYLVTHRHCPKCGDTPARVTEVAYPVPPDLNVVKCYDCNWIGTVHECVATKKEVKMQITADLVIEKYIETRDLIESKKKALDAELADLKATQERREIWLRGKMDELGVTSLKSAKGTCFVDWKDSSTVSDWDAFLTWVRENEEFDFLEHRVSKTAVKQRLEDSLPPPPGVNYTKVKDVKIRRS